MEFLRKIAKKLHLSEAMKNVAKISSGTVLGQAISLITLPIFKALYGASIIGVWSVLNSIATIVTSFSDLGLSNAIMIEEDEKSMLRLYKVISTIAICISLVSSLLVGGYYFVFGNTLDINIIFMIIYLFLAIFTLQQTQICYSWLNRKGMYDILMKNPLINNGIFGLVGIAIGIIGSKILHIDLLIAYGYFVGWLIGQFVTLMHMKRFIPKSMFTFKKDDFVTVIKMRKRFIEFQLPTNIISNVKNQLPVLLVKGLFGKEVVGYYSIANRILNVPITFLANAMGRVYFKTVSEMKRAGKSIGQFTYRNLTKAMKVAIIPMIGLIVLGDIIIKILFGADSAMAGNMLRIVSLQTFFTFLMMTVQGLSITLEKQNYSMISCILQSVGYLSGLAIGKYVFGSVYIGLALMSVFFIIVNVTYFCMLFKVMNISWKKYLKHVLISISIILVLSLVLRWIIYFIGFVPTM